MCEEKGEEAGQTNGQATPWPTGVSPAAGLWGRAELHQNCPSLRAKGWAVYPPSPIQWPRGAPRGVNSNIFPFRLSSYPNQREDTDTPCGNCRTVF